MDVNKTHIKDEDIERCPEIMSFIKPLIDNEELARTKEGYRYTRKHIKKAIRSAKHIQRYAKYEWYRSLTDIYRDLTSFFK